MTKYVIDSWAWIEYLQAAPKSEKIKQVLEDSESENYTSVVSLAEVVSKLTQRQKDTSIAIQAIRALSRTVELNQDLAIATGLIHAEVRKTVHDFGFGDAFVLALARQENLKILTGDPDFKHFKETVFIS